MLTDTDKIEFREYYFVYYYYFYFSFPFLDVAQNYETRVSDEFVIIRNDALLKCSVPSYAVDFLILNGWVTNEGLEIDANFNENGKPKLTLNKKRDGEMMTFEILSAIIFKNVSKTFQIFLKSLGLIWEKV